MKIDPRPKEKNKPISHLKTPLRVRIVDVVRKIFINPAGMLSDIMKLNNNPPNK